MKTTTKTVLSIKKDGKIIRRFVCKDPDQAYFLRRKIYQVVNRSLGLTEISYEQALLSDLKAKANETSLPKVEPKVESEIDIKEELADFQRACAELDKWASSLKEKTKNLKSK